MDSRLRENDELGAENDELGRLGGPACGWGTSPGAKGFALTWGLPRKIT